jgi:hypothetical protein
MTLAMSLLFEIAEMKYGGRIRLFNGSDKVVIMVGEFFVIVL